MEIIKVAVLTVPSMLREVLNQLLDSAADIERVDPPPELQHSGENSFVSPDVMLLATQNDSDEECWKSLAASPASSVLAMDRRGQNAFMFQLRRHKEVLGEPSADRILAAIRRAARRPDR